MMLRAPGLALAALLLAGCAAMAPEPRGESSIAPLLVPTVHGPLLTGTGFFVSNRGHLVTAYHVVRERESVAVRMAQGARPLPATVLKRDPNNDLALLKVEAITRPLDLARWQAVPVGLEAYVVGYPLPGLQGGNIKITEGLYNGEAAIVRGRRLFQLSAQVQTGNSGGPVLSPDGLVMGVVQSKLDAMLVAQKVRDLPQNVNFAINSAVLADFLENTGAEPRVQAPQLGVHRRPYEVLRMSVESVVMVLAREPATAPLSASP